MRIFDAHLDLAYLAEAGRDMSARAEAVPGAAATLPTLIEAGFTDVFATIFVQRRNLDASPEKRADGPWCYSSEEEAHVASLRQVGIYLQWHEAGWIKLRGVAPRRGKGAAATEKPIGVTLLLEGAAGIRTATDLKTFHQAGLRVVALTWVEGTKYAGGDQSGEDISADGRALVRAIDELEMVHDVSHLSERAFWSLMSLAGRPKVASHSNCRALLPGKKHPERHLSDEQIRALVNGGGMIGVNLFGKFLTAVEPATVDDVVRHVRHIAELTGRTDCIGLGTDMDGGFAATNLPVGLHRAADLPRLFEALRGAGFGNEEVEGMAWGNWARFMARHCGPFA